MKHEVKSIPSEEILANRCNAYEFLNFNKQETLEEASNRAYSCGLFSTKTAFIAGVKWQQQRSYSKEDVINLLEFIRDNAIETTIGWQINSKEYSNKQIIKQFKNK